MSDREVPFDEDATCDGCGKIGAFDFMGDFYCPKCAEQAVESETDDDQDEEVPGDPTSLPPQP